MTSGSNAEGLQPILLTLPSLAPALALEILPRGLTFHRFYAQVGGRTHDLVIGPEKSSDHLTQKYTNTIIGRYANRIPVGTHKIERGGFTGELSVQANESPKVSLHGGPTGFDSVVWELISPSPDGTRPSLFTSAELSHLPSSDGDDASPTSWAVFRHISPSGDQGYPGTLTTEVLITLLPPPHQEIIYQKPGDAFPEDPSKLGSLVYVYRARLDEGGEESVTAVNLTQHWGFNLEASLLRDSDGEGKGSLFVKEHELTIKADKVVALDGDALHSGEYILASSTPAHKHDKKKIGDECPDKGYDDFYILEKRSHTAPKHIPVSSLTGEKPADLLKDILNPEYRSSNGPVVELGSENSGLKLEFDTNQNGVMFYSNGFARPEAGARKKIHGGSGEKGDGYSPGTAVFLEFHDVLTAFLDPANKDGDDTLLTKDEVYHNFVRCDVLYKETGR